MKCIASKKFAMDLLTLGSVMASIATNGRKRFKSGIPSAAVIRYFRARNPDITFRNSENKENAKLKGESFEHVQTYAHALRQVEKETPDIFEDGDRFFNLDETAVDGEFGHKVKVFGSADTHHGGFRVSSANSGTGMHVTAVVVTSASGRKLPPFFVFAGKNTTSSWFELLSHEVYKDGTGVRPWLAIQG